MDITDEKFLDLTQKQMKAIEGLLLYGDQVKACKYAGVGQNTMTRYLRNASFRYELRRRRDEQLQRTHEHIAMESLQCVQTLCSIRDDENVPAGVRVRACDTLLRYAVGDDTEKRLREIELALSTIETNYNGN